MSNPTNKFKKIEKSHLYILAAALIVLLAIVLLWFSVFTSVQAAPALVAQVYFDGEYRIADGDWQKYVKGTHISATKGDVTLRGNFHMLTPDGEYVGIYRGDIPVAFYTDHIGLTIYEGEGNEPYVVDSENPLYGDSACGATWTAYTFYSDSEETIEIVVHNPHKYGNENAIDEMLAKVSLWSGIEFEKEILNSGETQRNIGLLFMIASLMILGIGLFSTLIHIKNSKIIWGLGTLILLAGLYFAYSADGVEFWNGSTPFNTTILGASMMLYMFFFAMIITHLLKVTQKIGIITVGILGATNAVFFILPIATDILFYDIWLWWIFVQLAADAVLIYCLIRDFINSRAKFDWLYIGALLPLLAFGVDVVGTWLGVWKGGVVSQYVFTALFVVAIIMVIKLIPQNINAAAKAKELEMEKIALNAQLTETRISTMMSQIRPHFIYNTLGSIEQLCEIDPKVARELVHDFAKYLRGNFGELDNPKPILMSQEMEHVHHYVSIENVRFPDMTFTFEMTSEDFKIPALTIQPIVENAIKHGLMRLENGGTIHVVSYETDTHYCVTVEDDGVGFDTTLLHDERKHVGLRNIRERLKAMVNGTLEINSTINEGTKVLIKIPKEASK